MAVGTGPDLASNLSGRGHCYPRLACPLVLPDVRYLSFWLGLYLPFVLVLLHTPPLHHCWTSTCLPLPMLNFACIPPSSHVWDMTDLYSEYPPRLSVSHTHPSPSPSPSRMDSNRQTGIVRSPRQTPLSSLPSGMWLVWLDFTGSWFYHCACSVPFPHHHYTYPSTPPCLPLPCFTCFFPTLFTCATPTPGALLRGLPALPVHTPWHVRQ